MSSWIKVIWLSMVLTAWCFAQSVVKISGIDPFITTGPSLNKEIALKTGDALQFDSKFACAAFGKIFNDIIRANSTIPFDAPKDYRLNVVFRFRNHDYDFWIHSDMSVIEDSSRMYRVSKQNRRELKSVIKKYCPQVFGAVRFRPIIEKSGNAAES